MLTLARVCGVVVGGILAAGSLSAQQSASGLLEAFQVALPNADVAILLDASGSMGAMYAPVRQAAVSFSASLTARETLHMRAFSSVPTVALEGAGDVAGPKAPQTLPERPLPGGTDLGLAIDKVLEFFERPGAAPLHAFFLLTDGRHQPPAGSPYPRDFDHSNWRALRARAHDLARRGTVLVYGFGLHQQTDIALLTRVFPATAVEIVVGGVNSVPEVLERMRQRLRARQILMAIQEELNSGGVSAQADSPALTSRDPEAKVRVVIRNGYRHLPVTLTALSFTPTPGSSAAVSAELQAALPIPLKPGESVQVIADVRGPEAQRGSVALGRREQVYTASFETRLRASFPDAGELRAAGIEDPAPRIDAGVFTVEFRLARGVPYWLLVVAGIVFAGGSFGFWRRRSAEKQRRARIALETERLRLVIGELRVWRTGESEPVGGGRDLAAFQAKELVLKLTGRGEVDILSSAGAGGSGELARIKGALGPASSAEPLGGRQCEIVVAPGHSLAYESGGAMRETAAPLTLFDRDLLAIDGQWWLRYTNSKFRRRYDVESSRRGKEQS